MYTIQLTVVDEKKKYTKKYRLVNVFDYEDNKYFILLDLEDSEFKNIEAIHVFKILDDNVGEVLKNKKEEIRIYKAYFRMIWGY